MKADPISVGKVLSEHHRFVVPIYQRSYTWSVKKQLEPLFDQIEAKTQERLQKGKVEFPHYMGSLLVIPEGEAAFGRVQAFDIVDGQQRLTTFHICFAALRDVARSSGFDDIAKSLANLLVHGDDVPMVDKKNERYKLQPTAYDRLLFRDLIDLTHEEIQKKHSASFHKNGKVRKAGIRPPLAAYWYFWDRAQAFLSESGGERRTEFLALTDAIFQNFHFIVITLSREDDAQVIFATLNSGGEPLAAMDLVRNDVFLRAARQGEDEEHLMEKYWSVFDQDFWKQEQTQGRITKPQMDFFLGHTLAAETGELISLTELYAEYKKFAKRLAAPSIAEEMSNITRYAPIYRSLVDPVPDTALSKLSHRLETFDLSTAYPLILLIAVSDANHATKEQLYDLIGSYIIRRALCDLTVKNYNIAFIEFASYLRQKGISVENFSAAAELRKNSDAAKFPTDVELRAAVLERAQYGKVRINRLRLILEELELASRDKFSAINALQPGLTVEHIMPQQWERGWPLPSGRFAPADAGSAVDEAMANEIIVRQSMIHTLGNLSLLTPPANASAGNANFEGKKMRLRDSLLRINSDVANSARWQETEIRTRAEKLANLAVRVWPAPPGI